jgi:hypothetical protein
VLDRGDAAEFVESDPAGEEGGGTAVASGGYPVAGQKTRKRLKPGKIMTVSRFLQTQHPTFNIQH